jgi:DNA-binding response OmpR family regulator
MTLQALLISTDDSASEIVSRALSEYGIVVERFSDLATAIDRLHKQRFDALVIDFEDTTAASEVLAESSRLNAGNPPITVALVAEPARARELLSNGLHFVLYKPTSEEKARAGLRAVTALLNRERRRAYRVPVQAPVELTLPDTRKIEGILLDLSETGMDVLTAEPQVAGQLLNFRFTLPRGDFEIDAHGQVAWANPNGQNGVHFLDLDESVRSQLKVWLQAAASMNRAGAEETVPHCKLTDLSLGGCYVETDSPFPEHALVDLCLKTNEMSVHTEGMVRVAHPGYGMGVEFPSRTPEQRAQVSDLINFLQNCQQSGLEMSVAPRSLVADISQFEHGSGGENSDEELEDPLLELLRHGTSFHQDDFLQELHRQRSGESVAT